ncbi:PAS domain S-box protein [Candidatus Cryosericum terrychapinii]|uniref:histidine kinase n=1 Tax=Candidatus Cryosericum terrychapinii TaxID=2290919 RepID=A0A398CVL6_9BACT|nr:PAS domain S-box protein [Candidatus Cryosericum terrychapinii]RIE06573.1 PAS domain S-box protein [Candidatus Cryosericum terrychapinii]
MSGKDSRPDHATKLRRQAEEIVQDNAAKSPKHFEALSPEETLYMLHELQVHQIELEMQNEELRKAQVKLDAGRARYFDLYDLAPVGYVTIGEQGLLLEANLTTTTLLGVTRNELIRQPFSRFVFREDQDIYYFLHKQLFETGEPHGCELRMVKKDGSAFWVRLQASSVQDTAGLAVSRIVINDITERKQAEERLAHEDDLLRLTGEMAHVGGWEFDVATGEGTWTDEVARIHGLDPAAPTNAGLGVSFYVDESRARIETAIKQAVEHGTPYDLELEIRAVNGEHKWVRTRGVPVQKQGKTVQLRGTFQDVTERRQAEEELRESHERFQLANRATFDTIRDWNLLTDALWWNENFQKVFNYPAEEIEPSIESWTKRIHPKDVDRVSTSVHTAIDSGQQSWSDHYRFRRKDGSFAEIEDRGYISRDVNGKPVRMIGAMQDVTQRKRGEDALRESEERYRTLIQNVGVGIGFVDPEEQFALANAAAEDIFGVPPGGLLGRSLREFTSPEQLAMIREQTDRRRAGEKSVYEIEISRPGGEKRNLLLTAVPQFDSQERFLGTHGAFHDITKQKREEAQLRQSQKMEAIGELAGGVAHDFNNLLTGILGNVTLMRSRLPPADPLLENLNAAETAAHQAADLTKGLLTFSRGAMVLPVPISITDALDVTLALLKQSLPATMEIVRDYGRTTWNILMDQSQMTQILLNLAVNARDAMDGKGTLIIRARNEVVEEGYLQTHPFARAGEFVHLSVTDTGPGIPPAILEHLFEPFHTTKPVGSGTGLGLSIVYGAVKQAGGWITGVSTEGVGATFDIYLPRCLKEPMQSFTPSPLPVNVGSGTILVVEDEPIVRAVAQTLLSRSGYTVLTAPDGASALNVLREHPVGIGLILLDMTMPGMTSGEIVHAIRALDPTVPILLNSGYTSNGAVKQMLKEDSVQGFLGKPYELQELLSTIHELMERP